MTDPSSRPVAARAGYTVREMVPGEADALSRLTVDVYRAVPGFEPGEGYLRELADVAGRAAVAVVLAAVDVGGELLGGVTYVAGAGPLADFDDPGDAGIRMLAVGPGARRRGVGTALVRACVDRARAEGRHRLWLHTTEGMVDAQRIYEREGFRRAPEADWIEGLHLVAYVLDLAPDRR